MSGRTTRAHGHGYCHYARDPAGNRQTRDDSRAARGTRVFRSLLAYILTRNIRVEEDLIDQLFNSSEKRLARTLLLLARYGAEDQPQKVLPKVSQEILAEMIGTTRSRVNLFMNKFRKLGFIDTTAKSTSLFASGCCFARLG